jgi:hypothetical protein
MNSTPLQPRAGPRGRNLLLCSAGLNLLLLAAAVVLAWRHLADTPPDAPLPPRPVRTTGAANAGAIAEPATGNTEPAEPGTNQLSFRWAQLESQDFRVYIANLRAVHCPESIIRDLVFYDLERLYENKEAEQPSPDLFWKPARVRDRASAEAEQRSHQMELEKRAVMRELIGAWWTKEARDLWYDSDMASIPEILVGYLRNEQVLEAISVYGDMEHHSSGECELCSPAEERARQEAAYRRTANAFAGIMSPSEFEEMALRICVIEGKFEEFSRADFHFRDGAEVREFAKLFNRHQPFFSKEFLRDEDEDDIREARFHADIGSLLGADRYAAWERSQDNGYQEIWNFGKERLLSPDTILKAWQVRQEAEQEFTRLSERTDLSPADRSAAWGEVRQQTETALATLLGNAAGTEYLKDHGAWLQRPPPKPEAKL